MSGFLKGDLFEGQDSEAIDQPKQRAKESRKLSNKTCPKCGKPGNGPYSRWVKNSSGKTYSPYYYFAHRINGKLAWCYVPRETAKELLEKAEKEMP